MSFGSYGWSGEGVKYADERIEQMKFENFKQGFKVQYVPNKQSLLNCVELGNDIGQAILNKMV